MTRPALYQNIPQKDPLEFWSTHGLDYGKVSRFLDLDKNELSKIGGVSKRSVRLDERIPHDLKERLAQVAIICTMVAEHFEGNVDKTALWFKTSNPMLGGISPREMIRFGRYKRLKKYVDNARIENSSNVA